MNRHVEVWRFGLGTRCTISLKWENDTYAKSIHPFDCWLNRCLDLLVYYMVDPCSSWFGRFDCHLSIRS